MGVIRIFANGLELDFEADTLTVKKENNAFITDFKVAASTYPFLIIENSKTLTALGPRDLTSVRKKKVVPVVVLDMGQRYYGEIIVRTYLTGYRKCDLKYGSDTLTIMDKKLSELMPVVSVILGETTPEPFTETALEVVNGYDLWRHYPLNFVGKIYPEAKYQFPKMAWKNKYFEDVPDPDDEWYQFKGAVNDYAVLPPGVGIPPEFRVNYFTIIDDLVSVFNTNVPAPQLFALAVLEYAFASIGYSIAGNFITSEMAKRLLVLSKTDNLCKVNVGPAPTYLDFDDLYDAGLFLYRFFSYDFVPTAAGEYKLFYYVQEPLRPGGITTQNHWSQLIYKTPDDDNIFNGTNIYKNVNDPDKLIFTGEVIIDVSEEQIGQTFNIVYARWYDTTVNPLQFTLGITPSGKDFYMMHPTINLGRYAPDMSVATFINNLKNLFSLAVTFDDVAKVAYFNFAADILTNPAQHIALKSLELSEYNTPEYTGYKLKYADETDDSLLVEATGTTLNSSAEGDLIQILENDFTMVPHNGYTADLGAADEKDGTCLMIYSPNELNPGNTAFVLPIIETSYNGYTLSFSGALGLYNLYYKKMLQFLLNGSPVEISGPFTETELRQIDKYQKIYIDNQAYVVLSVQTKQTQQDNYDAKLELKSINF